MIKFDAVQFAYPTRPEMLVLNDFSIEIPAGRSFALVGQSGSGKSTITSLIERFYDPLSGSISIDGIDISQLNIRWLREQVSLSCNVPYLVRKTKTDDGLPVGRPCKSRTSTIRDDHLREPTIRKSISQS